MGLLSFLGLKKEPDTHLEEEISKLKEVVEKHDDENIRALRSDIRSLFSEVQNIKSDIKNLDATTEKQEFKLDKLAEKMVEIDNDMLKVVYKDELNLLKKEMSFIEEDVKTIKDSQHQITDKFIDFALKEKETKTAPKETSNEDLTEFEEGILSKYKNNITSEQISKETGMSKGHISRTLKALHKKGYLTRTRKGKEFIYNAV